MVLELLQLLLELLSVFVETLNELAEWHAQQFQFLVERQAEFVDERNAISEHHLIWNTDRGVAKSQSEQYHLLFVEFLLEQAEPLG